MAYREQYRGVGFHQTRKGYWFFDEICPSGKHWSRYTDNDDLTNLSAETMRRTIDNYHARRVVYRGDIRDR